MPYKSPKSENKSKGKKAEQVAADFLQGKGFKILAKNFAITGGEIDIIAEINNVLVFVEVKSRKNADYGFPELAVNKQKKQTIRRVADQFILDYTHRGDIRFDIISITGKDIFHIEDAF